jgi:hypothetical protein
MEKAPFARGFFLGDYQGLTAVGRDFLTFFAQTTSAANSADIVSVRMTAPRDTP